MIEVKDGVFYYNKDRIIINHMNFSLKKGKIMAVMGQNGVGKTTLMKCIVGLLPWKSGSVYIDGKAVQKDMAVKIGYVPQNQNRGFDYSVSEMILFGRIGRNGYFATPRSRDYTVVDEILRRTDMYELRDRPCNQLSGGQLQRVFIGRALAMEPVLLVLDEAESHLDFKNQLRLSKLIKNYVREFNVPCIINTHYPDYATDLADYCLMMGKNDYIFGDVESIMLEENFEKYFDIYAKKTCINHNGRIISSFIFVDEVHNKN